LMVDTFNKLINHLDMPYRDCKLRSKIWQTVQIPEPILELFKIDTRYIFADVVFGNDRDPGREKVEADKTGNKEDVFVDEWGIKRKFILYYYEIVEHPLKNAKTVDDVDKYPWPDPKKCLVLDGLRDKAKHLYENTDYAIGGSIGGGIIYELSWYLRGFTELLLDLQINKDFIHALYTKIAAIRKEAIELYLGEVGEFLDIFQIGDDLAVQNTALMRPDLYREMIKPYHAEVIEFIKKRTKAKIYYHSCGAVSTMLGDLIEIGVDAINPVQVSAKNMNIRELKRLYGKNITFWGGIDSQKILPSGTTDEVRAFVRHTIDELAPGGGYILAGVHNLQPDVPPENIVAMYEEAVQYGKYPIAN
jgi:uroporphyrinogen decarboxylase